MFVFDDFEKANALNYIYSGYHRFNIDPTLSINLNDFELNNIPNTHMISNSDINKRNKQTKNNDIIITMNKKENELKTR